MEFKMGLAQKLKYFWGDIVVAKYKYDDQTTKMPLQLNRIAVEVATIICQRNGLNSEDEMNYALKFLVNNDVNKKQKKVKTEEEKQAAKQAGIEKRKATLAAKKVEKAVNVPLPETDEEEEEKPKKISKKSVKTEEEKQAAKKAAIEKRKATLAAKTDEEKAEAKKAAAEKRKQNKAKKSQKITIEVIEDENEEKSSKKSKKSSKA
jgi:hypothetical protein